MGRTRTATQWIGVSALCLSVSGCMDATGFEDWRPSVFDNIGSKANVVAEEQHILDPQMAEGEASVIIGDLLNRRSVLPDGPLSQISDAVLDANSRAAEADLRAARLRAEAESYNWLPQLGPQVSLTSLGDVVASLVVDQVLFDNGRKKADREYARADVEVAAVALALDTNQRVLEALKLYLDAESARASARVTSAGLGQMERFSYIMSERVRGGVSNRVDLQVIEQRLGQMRSDYQSYQESAAMAIAELSAMSARSIKDVRGISAISQASGTPLAVLKARAEGERTIASAKAERAGYLPGLSAQGTATESGTNFGLNIGIPNGFGFGNGAATRAIDAKEQAARAREAQTQEDINRSLNSLKAELQSLQRKLTQARQLASQANRNYTSYQAQLKEGQRTVSEVVGVFETKIRTEREAVTIEYEIARVELEMAAIRGTLVDGDRI